MRKYFIDNLRWLDVLLLIPYHAAQAWNTWQEPNYIFFDGSRAISSIIVFFSPYFMPLLFLLAGMNTRYSLAKRSKGQYLAERAKRLLVPLIFGVAVLMPPLTFIAAKANLNYSGSFFEHYGVFFTKFTDLIGADGGFSFGQFWFLLYLFVISAAAVGVISLLEKFLPKKKPDIPFPVICLLGAPLPLLSELLSVGGKSLAEYTYIFLLGYYIFSDDKTIDKLEKYSPLTFPIGLAASLLNVWLFIWSGKDYGAVNTAAMFTSKWFMLLALIGLGKRFLDTGGRLSRCMSVRSFPYFSFHFLILVAVQYALSGPLSGNTPLLYLIPVLSAFVLTLLCCELCLRVKWLSFLLGTKPISKDSK